ncbi:MAG: hypothetical protein UY48_C0014G0006 [Candidatus Gottesmanbacteria bacterium GW2011_GWB1_49_7]|uniref:DUF2029 domain-containing protein n=1 Tax=Candidatus Gottesmanbacteria bacterium GW2011_GWB1_49_7 TaxID=1618448 RepID=A0A0G1YZ83_9BACT|nr:MAG: hypothetical protein UY48_C0014G0006 [Candidatus Gottesmanbacteria bacterium GW2011_GWB1_49_7]
MLGGGSMGKKLFIGYILAALALFLFSYTQVDLSLTLSRFSIYQTIQKSFQYIGYYQRPTATALYVGLVGIFFTLYGFTLFAVRRGKLSHVGLWRVIIALTIILVFSYPAFSYDLFNYMFDAKTILVYHKNPYLVTPLEFSGVEPWLSFMHWTHEPTNYMPFWIVLSLPAYLLGFGYFLGIMWSFKALVAGAYLVTIWFIGRILSRLDAKHSLLGMAIFAFNPLVIFESLVSGHNDVVMLALAMIAYWLYLQRKRLPSFFALALSIATKLMTAFLVPVFFLGWQRNWALWAMIFAFIAVGTQRELLPWYVIWLVPFYALLPRLDWMLTIGTGASLGFLFSYAPFLYFGDYNPPVSTLKLWCVATPIMLSLVWIGYRLICPPNRPQV